MSDQPNISIVTILNDIPDLYKLIEYHWETIDYPKEKLEWIIIDNSRENNSDKIPTLSENIIYIHVNTDEFIDKINFDRDDEKILWNYYKRLGYLPIGFLRDYAVGCTQYDYILHYDIDTIYNPKTLLRKLRTLKNNKLECIYCKCMLGYDIYEKGLYKLENEHSGYASTLFHTRDFWKRSGFKWTDIDNEAYNFLLNRFYYPSPRIMECNEISLFANSAIDISDGLVSDLSHLCNASNCGAEINIDLLPLSEALSISYPSKDAINYALNGGDDYEICFSAPKSNRKILDKLSKRLKTPFTRIGKLKKGDQVKILYKNKPYIYSGNGYKHF